MTFADCVDPEFAMLGGPDSQVLADNDTRVGGNWMGLANGEKLMIRVETFSKKIEFYVSIKQSCLPIPGRHPSRGSFAPSQNL